MQMANKLTPREIIQIYDEMMSRQRYEGSWVKADGSSEITDVGYAIDGAYMFLEELVGGTKEFADWSEDNE